MNKNLIYGVVGAVVILVLGYFIISNTSSGQNPNGAPTIQTEGASSGTLASLMSMGSVKCDVTNTQAGAQSSGTVYVGGGKMRGDFTSQTSAGAVTSHMISDGTNVYVWSSAMPQGIKMTVAATAKPGNAQATMYNQNVSYTCSPWSVDASQFILPAGVTFSDMTSMMQGSTGANAGASAGTSAGANCAMCDQAGAGRDQCRAALGCK